MGLPGPMDFRVLAERRQCYEGDLQPERLQRLQDLLAEGETVVNFRVCFGFDDNGFVRAWGELEGSLPLECQRSLTAFDWKFSEAFEIGIVDDEAEEARFGEACEVLVADDGKIVVQALLEDELILLLPVVPLNPEASAPPNPAAATDEIADEENSGESDRNPFSDLAALKNKH